MQIIIMNSIKKEHIINNNKWCLIDDSLDGYTQWSSGYLCPDGDKVILYISKDETDFRLECFSGSPASYIVLNYPDFRTFYEKVGINEDASFEYQCCAIADYLCSVLDLECMGNKYVVGFRDYLDNWYYVSDPKLDSWDCLVGLMEIPCDSDIDKNSKKIPIYFYSLSEANYAKDKLKVFVKERGIEIGIDDIEYIEFFIEGDYYTTDDFISI